VQEAEIESVRLRKAILEAQVATMKAEADAASRQLELRIQDTRALDDARAAVHQAEAAIAMAQAMRDSAALTLSRMQVRATTGGIVMTRLAEPGSKLMLNMDNPHSAQAVRLYNPEKLQVRVDVPLSDAAKIGVGQPAEIIVDVLPNRVFQGRISRVVHEADVQKNTLQVKVAIADPIEALKPEMLARARFLAMPKGDATTDDPAQAYYAPQRAVFDGADGKYVWLADQATGTASQISVVTGTTMENSEYIELREGVRLGDRLIVNPPAQLKHGARIRIASEMKEARDGTH
jgi:RND family efflux transporter MFP subunit